MVRAASLQETLQGVARFVGPLSAGFLIAALDEAATLWIAAGLFLLAVALVAGVARQEIDHEQPLTPRQAYRDMRAGFRFLRHEPLLGPLTLLLVAWTAVYVPLATLVFPAWFVFAGQGAGALGLFLGAQALGNILGGLVFAVVSTRVSRYAWFLPTNVASTACLAALLLTDPGSVAAVALSFLVGLISAGSLPIINTAYYSRTPERLLGRAQGASWSLVLSALPLSSLAMGWLVNGYSAATGLVVVVSLNVVMILAFALIPAMRLLDSDDAPARAEKEVGA
jgi:Major Facilitator Superfamily